MKEAGKKTLDMFQEGFKAWLECCITTNALKRFILEKTEFLLFFLNKYSAEKFSKFLVWTLYVYSL